MLQRPSTLPYRTYAEFLQTHFAHRIQKLPVDAGAGCPVRDGKKGVGGCAFCNAVSFAPPCSKTSGDVVEQLEAGKAFFAHKNKQTEAVGFLAYFQSGTNTYPSVGEMKPLIEAALGVESVEGIVLATRPDCITEEWIDYLEKLRLQTFVMVELGVESVEDDVLKLMGRGHTYQETVESVEKLKKIGVALCAHLIIGLPGEKEDAPMRQAQCINQLGVDVVKLHQLQILKGSRLATWYERNPENFHSLSLKEYSQKAAVFVHALRPNIAIERFVSQSPAEQLIAPRWGVKNEVVTQCILKEIEKLAQRSKTEQSKANIL